MNATHSTLCRTAVRRDAHERRYPNAASSRYYLEKLADGLLCTASGIGIVAIIFFFITM